MPARDIYHNRVKNALIANGWTITHDPLKLEIGAKDLYVDLGAMKLIAAEKEEYKIAVEVKSFVSKSDIDELEKALGQYILYNDVLADREPERILYLAVPQRIFKDLFEEPIGKLLLKNRRVKLIVFDEHQDTIAQWIQ
ncbi:MAG: XisH family protein [Hydrococcus sp. Prado102]|jgi:hypothetical protein|nr:XisH family protein [Hydrococcus sp. Prado102]